jgi:hypothetical protein
MQVKIGEESNNLAHEARGATAVGPDPDTLAAQVGQPPDPIGVQAKERKRLGLAEVRPVECVAGRPVHPLLDEGEVDITGRLCGDQPRDVLDPADERLSTCPCCCCASAARTLTTA